MGCCPWIRRGTRSETSEISPDSIVEALHKKPSSSGGFEVSGGWSDPGKTTDLLFLFPDMRPPDRVQGLGAAQGSFFLAAGEPSRPADPQTQI